MRASPAEMADVMGTSDRAVRRLLDDMEALGALRVQRSPRPGAPVWVAVVSGAEPSPVAPFAGAELAPTVGADPTFAGAEPAPTDACNVHAFAGHVRLRRVPPPSKNAGGSALRTPDMSEAKPAPEAPPRVPPAERSPTQVCASQNSENSFSSSPSRSLSLSEKARARGEEEGGLGVSRTASASRVTAPAPDVAGRKNSEHRAPSAGLPTEAAALESPASAVTLANAGETETETRERERELNGGYGANFEAESVARRVLADWSARLWQNKAGPADHPDRLAIVLEAIAAGATEETLRAAVEGAARSRHNAARERRTVSAVFGCPKRLRVLADLGRGYLAAEDAKRAEAVQAFKKTVSPRPAAPPPPPPPRVSPDDIAAAISQNFPTFLQVKP